MSESCVIDGNRCTSCCRSIAMPMPLSFYRNIGRGDALFVGGNWKPLKARQAKKRNRFAFDGASKYTGKKKYWFRCSKVTLSGCSVHAERPDVCRDYPRYGMSDEQFAEKAKLHGAAEYHPDCTEWKIPAVSLD